MEECSHSCCTLLLRRKFMMKKRIFLTLVSLLFGIYVFSQNNRPLENKEDSISYALGMDLGKNLFSRITFKSFNYDLFVKGLKDVQKENETLFDNEEVKQIINSYFMQSMQEQGNRQMKKSMNFLEENRKKEGIKETESGLQYQVVQKGKGEKPQDGDQVKVHYTGKTMDGKVFDSSRERGEPITVSLKNVIAGWNEGLQLMNKGSRYKLFIPPELGYGERGAGNDIGPNEVLIFDIELIDVNPEKPVEGKQPE